MKALTIGLLLISLQAALSLTGIYVSNQEKVLDVDTYRCFSSKGYEALVVRAWNGKHGVNKNYPQNMENAIQAGIPYYAITAFVCNNCDQNKDIDKVLKTIQDLIPADFMSMVIYFEIEHCDKEDCWLSYKENLEFVGNLTKEAEARGLRVGILASKEEWKTVMGSYDAKNDQLADTFLWYDHKDSKANFEDKEFYNFGGWQYPSIKLFDTGDICDIKVDTLWSPGQSYLETSPLELMIEL